MAKHTPAEIYKDVACAVIARLSSLGDEKIGRGDAAADQREAAHVRATARMFYDEIAEEMELLDTE